MRRRSAEDSRYFFLSVHRYRARRKRPYIYAAGISHGQKALVVNIGHYHTYLVDMCVKKQRIIAFALKNRRHAHITEFFNFRKAAQQLTGVNRSLIYTAERVSPRQLK